MLRDASQGECYHKQFTVRSPLSDIPETLLGASWPSSSCEAHFTWGRLVFTSSGSLKYLLDRRTRFNAGKFVHFAGLPRTAD